MAIAAARIVPDGAGDAGHPGDLPQCPPSPQRERRVRDPEGRARDGREVVVPEERDLSLERPAALELVDEAEELQAAPE